jgi:folate-binding protein YgfZ
MLGTGQARATASGIGGFPRGRQFRAVWQAVTGAARAVRSMESNRWYSPVSNEFYSAVLREEALIHLRGNGIGDFLQGQLTCDLRRLSSEHAVAGAMCTVKGRVISDLWVIAVDDGHACLRLRRAVADAFAENLERYARFSRITVAVDERRDAISGYYGDDIPLPALGLDAVGACTRAGTGILLRSAYRMLQRVELPDDGTDGAHGAEDVLARARAGSEGDWRALELLSGHLALEERDREQFTPQVLNFDRNGRVAFDKGCYTGQEVVARLHYKGRAKQRLQIFRSGTSGSTSAVQAGAAVLDREGRAVGEILRAETLWDRDVVVAALLRHDEIRDDLRLSDGRELDRVGGAPDEG